MADCEEQLFATCFAISAPTAFSRTHICHYPNLKHQAHVSHQQPGRNPCGFSSSVAGDGLTGVIAVTRSRPVRRQPTFQCRCSFVAHEKPQRERRTNQARLKDFLYYSYLIVSDYSSPNSVKKATCLDANKPASDSQTVQSLFEQYVRLPLTLFQNTDTRLKPTTFL